MKLPEREIQKSLSILKAHHFLSALQEQEKSVFEEDSSRKGAVSLPVVLDVHICGKEGFTVEMRRKMGEKMMSPWRRV